VKPALNLLEMVPVPCMGWQCGADGLVQVLVPRYGRSSLGRWVAHRLGREHIVVQLDTPGSRLWLACDGKRSVAEIMAELGPDLPGQAEKDATDRLATFLRHLERNRFIRMQPTAG
jgi:hypothetical protein